MVKARGAFMRLREEASWVTTSEDRWLSNSGGKGTRRADLCSTCRTLYCNAQIRKPTTPGQQATRASTVRALRARTRMFVTSVDAGAAGARAGDIPSAAIAYLVCKAAPRSASARTPR